MTSNRFPLFLLLVAAVAALVYLPTLRYPLVWDDTDIIANNSLIRGNNPFIYFSNSFWAGSPALSLGRDPYYRPLTNFTFWLDYHAGGGKPLPFHLHNILIFCLLTALLILLLARLTRSRRAALFGGLFFAVFPLHSEVVSYVSGRTDLLMSLWIVVTAYAFARLTTQTTSHKPQAADRGPRAADRKPLSADRNPQTPVRTSQSAVRTSQSAVLWSLLSLLAFALACFSKETALAFPVIALVWFALLKDKTRLQTATVLGFFLVAIIYLYARFSVLHSLSVFNAPSSVSGLLLHSLNSFGLNCGLQVAFFLPRLFFEARLFNGPSLFTLLGVLALVVPLLFWRRLSLAGRIGYVWLVVFLLPFASLVSLGPVGRLNFLPGVGVLLFALPGPSGHRLAPGRIVGLLVAVLALGMVLNYRNRYWQSESALFTRMTAEAPSSVAGHFNLATVHDRQGNRDLAAREYRAALRLQPDIAAAHNNLGAILQAANEPDSALLHYREAVRLAPGYPQAHNNLAIMLRAAGDTRGAIAEFQRAIELRPDDVSALYNLARIYFAGRDFDSASPLLDRAVRLRPDDARIRALVKEVQDSLRH